jgi:hypothetical protein
MVDETEFERELELFRRDEEEAQQHFFCWLSVRSVAAHDEDIAGVMNTTPLFWITTHKAMLVAAFVSLGRLFDQKSEHNLDRLICVTAADLTIFSKDALQVRKEAHIGKTEAVAYGRDAYELKVADIRKLKKQVNDQRTIYNARYRDIRNTVFAHNGIPDPNDVEAINALFGNTNIEEMKDILGFLHALHGALDQVFLNGRYPEVTPYKFDLTREPRAPGERVYREANEMLRLLGRGARNA